VLRHPNGYKKKRKIKKIKPIYFYFFYLAVHTTAVTQTWNRFSVLFSWLCILLSEQRRVQLSEGATEVWRPASLWIRNDCHFTSQWCRSTALHALLFSTRGNLSLFFCLNGNYALHISYFVYGVLSFVHELLY